MLSRYYATMSLNNKPFNHRRSTFNLFQSYTIHQNPNFCSETILFSLPQKTMVQFSKRIRNKVNNPSYIYRKIPFKSDHFFVTVWLTICRRQINMKDAGKALKK